MARIVLFHHVQGLTDGVIGFADTLRVEGHEVHTPDLLEGETFGDIAVGVAHVEQLGWDTIIDRGVSSVEGLGTGLVLGGFSMGVLPAQKILQNQAGHRAALFYHGALPVEALGGDWPEGLPGQIHFMENDPWGTEDIDAGRALAGRFDSVELFLYPGSEHLFTDASLDAFDVESAALVMERTLGFLAGIG